MTLFAITRIRSLIELLAFHREERDVRILCSSVKCLLHFQALRRPTAMVFIVEFAVMVILGTLRQAHGPACPLNFDYFSKPGSDFLCGSTANYLTRVLAFHTNTTASPRPLFLGLDGCWETISKLDTSPECKSSLEIYSPDYASPCKFATLQELEGNFTIANITFDGLLKVCTSSLSCWELFTSNLRSLSNVTKDTPWVCETALQIALLSTDVLNENWARKFENLFIFFPLPLASRKRNKKKELAYTVSLILVCSAMPFAVLSYFIWKVLKNPRRSASIHNARELEEEDSSNKTVEGP